MSSGTEKKRKKNYFNLSANIFRMLFCEHNIQTCPSSADLYIKQRKSSIVVCKNVFFVKWPFIELNFKELVIFFYCFCHKK